MGKIVKTDFFFIIKTFFFKFLYFATFIALWQLIIIIFKIKEFILPSPFMVFRHLFDPTYAAANNWPLHISATILEVLVSFITTVVIGIILSVLLCWSKLLSDLISPIIILFNSLPKIALTPLFLL